MIELVSDNLWQLWAAVAVLCLIVELFTTGFFIACFSIGALFAMLASFICGIYGQLAVFVVFSGISIFLVRPFALRYLYRSDGVQRTNADAIIGRTGIVSQTIEAGGFGRVAVGGDDWKAVSEDGECIEAGVRVTVISRESLIIKVTKL